MRQVVIATAVLWMGVGMSASAQTVVDFEKDKAGSPPAGFQMALTGSGKPGVWVVVEDSSAPSGHLVLALDRSAFTLSDNGKPQTLTVFASDEQPITVVMMLDRSVSMRSNSLAPKFSSTCARTIVRVP